LYAKENSKKEWKSKDNDKAFVFLKTEQMFCNIYKLLFSC